ncbi:MAG: sulfatase-like hydrolase/transferase [Oscillospiraceae bacterium]|nr:sulfatase-like hydrolase/transferase [Oscillospiraceae bacterium]
MLIECVGMILLRPESSNGLLFGALWSVMLAAFLLLLPRKAGRILFGILYYVAFLWTIAQAGYYQVFGKMMWLSTTKYAGEGAAFLGDVLGAFSSAWWISLVVMLALGGILIWKYPKVTNRWQRCIPCVLIIVLCVGGLFGLPELVFKRDLDVWGTRSEYGQSSAYRATYNTMYDVKKVYDITGIYQLTFRDLWVHEIHPLTPAYRKELSEQSAQIDEYFAKRGESGDNSMTGIFKGKNVILVLLESMDDWLITEEDTPNLLRMMEEGINFTNFYTPGFGSARTLNSEFCMNTGIYLPTTGAYVFNYVNNAFNQSFAAQMTDVGYSSHVFHYNTPEFYSRGVFEPVMGYEAYNCYADYESDKDKLYDDCLLFDIPQLNDLFFREGPTFNTIITRSAHLSYKYNEVLSHWALKQYPEYRGMYSSEEEDCARLKAKLVDNMFARLLEELAANGQLENTVIIGITDHYTYGYKNMDELYAHSGVDSELLLEKTPCFVWSVDCPDMEVDKELSTADFLPTMLNLLGIESPHRYLGQDAFDESYPGYVVFPDGSWICDGVAWKNDKILMNKSGREVTAEEISKMAELTSEFIGISNLLLTSDYYR